MDGFCRVLLTLTLDTVLNMLGDTNITSDTDSTGPRRVHGYSDGGSGASQQDGEAWVITFPLGSKQLILEVRNAECVVSKSPEV